MSRRYWSSDPSSYPDFLPGVTAIRGAAPWVLRRGWVAARSRDVIDPAGPPGAGSRSSRIACSRSANTLEDSMPPDLRQPRNVVRRIRPVAVVHEHRAAAQQRIGDEAPVPT